MLLLSENDIKNSLSMNEAIGVIEEAFHKYAEQNFVQPDRIFSTVKNENTLLLMPCFVDDCIGLKVVTAYPSNRGTSSPVTQGLVLIHDIETGDSLALLNGTFLTTLKTGAVTGVAMRHFKKDAKTVGLVGTGLQGYYQLIAAQEATSVETVYLYNRSPEAVASFIQKFRTVSKDIEIIAVTVIEDLIRNSEIIITATTSVSPVLPEDMGELYKNKLIIGVGSYKSNMRELPQSLFEQADCYYIDSEQGKTECGDIIDPLKNGWVKENQVVLLSDVLAGNRQVPQNENPIVFKTVSMALFDAYIGNTVYKKAKELGIGQSFEL